MNTESLRLTCNTCRIQFDDIPSQRLHFKQDFHRFNLKRKAAALAPVSLQVFEQLLLQIERDNAEVQEDAWICHVCNKKYGSHRQIQQHLNSNRHKELAAESDLEVVYSSVIVEKSESESFDEEGFDQMVEDFINDPETLNECLFCSTLSESFESNLEHMYDAHRFVFPLGEYLIDKEGLFCYLATKVKIAYMCIGCPYSAETGRAFSSVHGCQAHMQDKGHLSFDVIENEVEYRPFYDLDKYFEKISNVEKLRNADIEFELPNGRVAINRQYALYYKRPGTENREIITLERTEEEKQIIQQEKQKRILTQKPKIVEHEHRKRTLRREMWNNTLLRRRWDQGTQNINF